MNFHTDISQQPLRPVYRRKGEWTLREHEVVVSHWPDKETIAKLLPHRSMHSIKHFAGRCNLRKEIHHWTCAEQQKLRQLVNKGIQRNEIAHCLGLTIRQVASQMSYIGLRQRKQSPKPTGNKLLDAVRMRAFEMNISPRQLDEACCSGNRFRRPGGSGYVHIKHIVRALDVLDGELTVEWKPLTDD